MSRALPLPLPLLATLALLVCPSVVLAQTRVDGGVSIGSQSFADSGSRHVLVGGEVLAMRHSFGLDVATEYNNLSFEGGLLVTHADVVYRLPFANGWFGVAGAGPTFASVGQSGHRTTWNAEAELGRTFGRAELFARIRQYDFTLQRFRAGDVGPNGPAYSLGVRFGLLP